MKNFISGIEVGVRQCYDSGFKCAIEILEERLEDYKKQDNPSNVVTESYVLGREYCIEILKLALAEGGEK
jgi:hypothetical protein|tara:strand:- start:69 stop:278 length:210 start_codon:yes stop_codon:yes gene_type:complete